MIIFLMIGIGLLIVGGWRLISWIRRSEQTPFPWLSGIRAGADALAWASGGALLLLTAVGGPEVRPGATVFLWVCAGATALAWSTSRLLRIVRCAGDAGLRVLVIRWTSRTVKRIGVVIRNGAQIIAPTGWRELRVGFYPLERLLAPGTMVRGYVLGLILIPVLLALTFTWIMNSGSIPQRNAVGAFVGYNALSVVSCLTAATILTLIAMAILTHSGALLIQLNVEGAFRTIAIWTGYGTAAGVVTAALLPLMSQLMPSTYASGQGEATALTPQILIDVPAAFAVVGYGIGTAVAVVALCRPAENLFLRRFVAPAMLMAVLIGLAHGGFGPGGILRAMTASMPKVGIADCTDDALHIHVDSPAWVFRAMDVCQEGEVYIENQHFLWSVGIVVITIAIVAFVADFRRDARKIVHADDSEREDAAENRS